MPKDYLREFDKRWPYLKNDNGVVSELKSFLTEAITASKQEARLELVKSQEAGNIPYFNMLIRVAKQEGREEAVAYIKENLPPDEQESCRDYKTAMMKVLEAAKEEKV